MAKLRRLLARLASLLHRGRIGEDFDHELQAHIAMHAEDGVRAGLTLEEARRQALLQLGGLEQARQRHRDGRSFLWLENLMQDLRYGARSLRSAPGFTVTAVATLALGIGACTAIFSMVNAVLLRSLPYGDPARLVYLFTPNPNLKIPAEVVCPSYADANDIKQQSRSFAGMTNFEQAWLQLTIQGAIQRICGARVDEDFFSTLEVAPEFGRALTSDDNQPGHDKGADISHSLWMSMFGGNAHVLDHSLVLDGQTYRIVGVMPREFEYPLSSDLPYGNSHIRNTEIWIPLALTPKRKAERDPDANVTVARLRPNVSIARAQSEMSSIMARLDHLHSGQLRGWGALVESFTGIPIGPVRPLMRLLLAAVGIVLLIACGNAASLLLARSSTRTRELSVRSALGAGRGRIVRQLLTEALMIGTAGGAMGLALAFLFLRLLPRFDPGNIPRLNEATIDTRVLFISIAVSLFTSALTGLLPAFSASRVHLTDSLKANVTTATAKGHSKIQSLLIVAQTAMVVILLAAAGLLIRSFIKVSSVKTGFSQSTVSMELALDQRYKTAQQHENFFKALTSKLEAQPGVQAAGAISDLPLGGSESIAFFWAQGFPNRKDQLSEARSVTPGYFSAMKIPLISGRTFDETDTVGVGGPRTAIVNERFARTYFAGRDPIGAHISTDDKHAVWDTVVGVVADVRHTSLEAEVEPQMYHANYEFDNASIVVSSSLPPTILIGEVRAVLKSMDPNLTFTEVRTMGELVSQASARRRFQTALLSAFAAISLLLAVVGLYGLMSYSVSRRTRELGIRMALGAARGDVLLLIVNNAARLIAAGLVSGLVCTAFAARAVRSFLFGVTDHDPATMILVCAMLIICGLVAAWIPARRAASIDPMQALRAE